MVRRLPKTEQLAEVHGVEVGNDVALAVTTQAQSRRQKNQEEEIQTNQEEETQTNQEEETQTNQEEETQMNQEEIQTNQEEETQTNQEEIQTNQEEEMLERQRTRSQTKDRDQVLDEFQFDDELFGQSKARTY